MTSSTCKDQPLVSVVIPIFNRVGTIERAIRSVLTQSYTNIEVIVVDDGSSDGSPNVVRSINDSRITLIELPKNTGVSYARNIGVSAAKGSFLAFQDSDDEWLAGKLERQIAVMDSQGELCVLVYCTKIVYARDESIVSFQKSAQSLAGIFCHHIDGGKFDA